VEDATVLDPLLNDTFARALETSGIRGARFSAAPGGVKVVAVTDSEQQVFAALGAVARGLKESRAGGRNVTKVEVVLATASGEPAGRFEMTPDDAESLLNGKTSSPKYFVANVQF
jgi:hypothetical protein